MGYAIRELVPTEVDQYCIQTITLSLPLLKTRVNFTSDFMIRTYTSGCYFYDKKTGKWSSEGVEVLSDTDITKTHCSSSHLTSFAGGLVVLPSAINFETVWANADFLKNPVIYSTLIAITCVYALFALWARLMDKRDSTKLNIVPLRDNLSSDKYFYEVIVFTGSRKESATNSKVCDFAYIFTLKNYDDRKILNGLKGENDYKWRNERDGRQST